MDLNVNGSYYQNQANLASIFNQMSSGSQINSAADDAAGLAISEKLGSLITGYEVGTNNAMDMQNLLKTAEGGLSSISTSLERIRELSVQAQNSIYSADDRAIMQYEVSSLLGGIKDAAKNTQFNSIKILDGSFNNANVASNPSGNGMKINIESAALEALGIEGYDLTDNLDISAIDNALNMVTEARSRIGAQTNALSSTISSNMTSAENLSAARSRIADTDYGKASIELNKAQVMEQIQIYAMKQQQEQAMKKVNIMGN